MDLNRLQWQQTIRSLALKGLNHFPTLEMWLEGQTPEATSKHYLSQGELESYEQWCQYLKAGLFQGIAIKDYDEWKLSGPEQSF
jgi:hypothetical protein